MLTAAALRRLNNPLLLCVCVVVVFSAGLVLNRGPSKSLDTMLGT